MNCNQDELWEHSLALLSILALRMLHFHGLFSDTSSPRQDSFREPETSALCTDPPEMFTE